MIVDNDRKRFSRRDLIMAGGLATAAGAAYALTPRNTQVLMGDHKLGDIIPDSIGPWHLIPEGRVVLPAEDSLAGRLYSQQLARTYVADGLPFVMLVIAYGSTQSDTLQMHRPEYCYPAAGFRMSGSREVTVPVGDGADVPCRFYTAIGERYTEQLLYWTRVGNYFPTTWANQHLTRMRTSLEGVIPDGVLVRMSLVSQDADLAVRTLSIFGTTMLEAVAKPNRPALIGSL